MHFWFLLFIAISSSNAVAVSFDVDGNQISELAVNSTKIRWRVLHFDNQEDQKFNAVASLIMGGTGALLDMRVPGDNSISAKAYILTAAHVVEHLVPAKMQAQAKADNHLTEFKPEQGYGLVTFQAMKGARTVNGLNPHVYGHIKQIVLFSSKGADVALLELVEPLEYFTARGISPLRIAKTSPSYAQDVLLVGYLIPKVSLAASPGKSFETAVFPIGDEFYKEGRDKLIKTDCCVYRGISGSPILNPQTNEIVGVLVGTDSTLPKAGAMNYYQPVWHLHDAFLNDGAFDLDAGIAKLNRCEQILNPELK